MNGVKLTGLWKSKTKDGKPMLSGTINASTRLLILSFDRKCNEKDPDYFAFVVPNEKREQAGGEVLP
jgi:hypothetical protein